MKKDEPQFSCLFLGLSLRTFRFDVVKRGLHVQRSAPGFRTYRTFSFTSSLKPGFQKVKSFDVIEPGEIRHSGYGPVERPRGWRNTKGAIQAQRALTQRWTFRPQLGDRRRSLENEIARRHRLLSRRVRSPDLFGNRDIITVRKRKFYGILGFTYVIVLFCNVVILFSNIPYLWN